MNAISDLGWTPLGCAALIGQFVELIEILVESGAQLESTAVDATSPQIAARNDVSGGNVVTYLTRKGADVNAIGDKFGSVLLATWKGHAPSFLMMAVLLDGRKTQAHRLEDFFWNFWSMAWVSGRQSALEERQRKPCRWFFHSSLNTGLSFPSSKARHIHELVWIGQKPPVSFVPSTRRPSSVICKRTIMRYSIFY